MKSRCSIFTSLLIISVLFNELVSSYENSRRPPPPVFKRKLVPVTNNVVQSRQLVNDDLTQRQIQISEYENLSQREESSSEESARARTNSGDNQKVVPSSENNGNSQVVYVNLARVVKDRNDTERVISTQPQLIKQDSQILCGETNRNGNPSPSQADESLQNRIVGGNKADPGEFPYQVRLNIRSRRGSSLCGGVIIDKRHILTAAHCMTTW